MKNILQKPIRFSDLSKAQKQEDIKDLKELKEKTEKLISKATDTINSLRTAANKLEVWKSSKITQAAGKGVSMWASHNRRRNCDSNNRGCCRAFVNSRDRLRCCES